MPKMRCSSRANWSVAVELMAGRRRRKRRLVDSAIESRFGHVFSTRGSELRHRMVVVKIPLVFYYDSWTHTHLILGIRPCGEVQGS